DGAGDECNVIVREAQIATEAAVGDGGAGAGDLAVDEREAIRIGGRAGLRYLRSAAQRPYFAIGQEGRAAAPNEIGVALNQTVSHIHQIPIVIVEHAILKTGESDVQEDNSLAIRAQSLGLAAAFGRAVG